MKPPKIPDHIPVTPLLTALRACSVEEQHLWAKRANTDRTYLYALATCQRESARAQLCKAIADASIQMHMDSRGRIPKVTILELATMCPIPELTAWREEQKKAR